MPKSIACTFINKVYFKFKNMIKLRLSAFFGILKFQGKMDEKKQEKITSWTARPANGSCKVNICHKVKPIAQMSVLVVKFVSDMRPVTISGGNLVYLREFFQYTRLIIPSKLVWNIF